MASALASAAPTSRGVLSSFSNLGQPRRHLVLVPGFAGFDALGQLAYYAGVTPLFAEWQKANPKVQAELHYFDNLPTASVSTRASRLSTFLAKRVARGAIQSGDEIVLIGHSTGGLDIRRLLRDLEQKRLKGEAILVDGAKGEAVKVLPKALLTSIKRLVFLSVPQKGTFIADWVKSHRYLFKAALMGVDLGLRATWLLPGLDWLNASLFQFVRTAMPITRFRRSQGLIAVEDSLKEICTNVLPWRRAGSQAAEAREAASELDLWLNHMIFDFGAIDDLAVFGSVETSNADTDLDILSNYSIKTKSFATRGARPFAFEPESEAGYWNLFPLSPSSLISWPKPLSPNSTDMDLIYLLCYRACAGVNKPKGAKIPWGLEKGQVTFPKDERSSPIEVWDSDGIVNTASMLWPNRLGMDEVRLVDNCDHGDIIGHFVLAEVNGAKAQSEAVARRQYSAYDLLGSGNSGKFKETFKAVWADIFSFSTSS